MIEILNNIKTIKPLYTLTINNDGDEEWFYFRQWNKYRGNITECNWTYTNSKEGVLHCIQDAAQWLTAHKHEGTNVEEITSTVTCCPNPAKAPVSRFSCCSYRWASGSWGQTPDGHQSGSHHKDHVIRSQVIWVARKLEINTDHCDLTGTAGLNNIEA